MSEPATVKDTTTEPDTGILVYTTSTCGSCHSLTRWLKTSGISFKEVNIDNDAVARNFVLQVANGYMSVPTVVFPDGTVLIEPSPSQVSSLLTSPGE